jgi:exosortase/archaeosortase family protein
MVKKAKKTINSSSKKNKKKTNNPKPFENNKNNTKIGLFLLKFFVIFTILSTIINLLDLTMLNSWLAYISATYTTFIIGHGLFVLDNVIFLNGNKFIVTNSCTGLVSASILASVIFSLKKPEIKKKIVLVLIGTIILLFFNLPRLMLVLLSPKAGFDADLIHIFTWYIMSGLILLIWYYGTKRFTNIDDFSELL